jgi:putative ABC transport system ATP-binding protein
MNALEAVGLKDKETKKAKELSGGEKQRVCIARALVGEPSVIFADEPTGNLDSQTSRIVEEMLFRLNHEKGITLILVTHDDELAAKCARVIELKDGEIISDRREAAAKMQPQSRG